MNPRIGRETPQELRDPWAGVEFTFPRKGVIDLATEDGYAQMRVWLREVDGRLRAWKVEVSVAMDPEIEQFPEVREKWSRVAVTPRMLASAPLATAEAAANLPYERWHVEGEPDELPVAPLELVVPDVRPYPESFWADVAATYIYYVLSVGVRNPAVEIADDTGAPVATVRGWIAKCRQLGLIAKGSQGRVG